MQSPVSILCYGHDRMLVRTRQQIFQRAGFRSQMAATEEALHSYFAEYAIDVLVICHSVTLDECESAKQLAHGQADQTLVLVLDKHTCKSRGEGADGAFDTLHGPERLLCRLNALLMQGGRDWSAPRHKRPLPWPEPIAEPQEGGSADLPQPRR